MNTSPTPSLTPAGAGAPEIPVYPRLPIEIVSGHGSTVVARDGAEYLDLYGGHAVASLGHAHPGLCDALDRQARALIFQTNVVELAIRDRAARQLVDFAPDGLDQVFLVSSGAEANENALRAAFKVRPRGTVVALTGGFHGRSAAAAACTQGSEGWYAFPRTPFDTRFVAPEDFAGLEAAIDAEVAAVILEPVQGIGGALDLSAGFVQRARALCDQHDALLIADEVQCGIGRCGTAFAIEHCQVTPDLLTTAKGLGGGFPVGALLVSDEVASHFGPGDLGTTFGGGPLACAAIECVLGEVGQPAFLARVRERGDWIRQHCRVGPVEAIQGRGLLVGLRVGPPAKEVLAHLRAHHILAGSAKDPHVVRLMPPLVVEQSELQLLREALLDWKVKS